VLTDDDIARMTHEERRALISRLVRPLHEVVPHGPALHQRRNVRIGLVAAAAILLVPWIVYLAFSLPGDHEVRNWDVMWVGFDGIELLLFALTLVLGWQRRVLAILTGFATGVVLLCDAWFDLMTANPGELWQSALAALVLEVPLALILMSSAFRAIRMGSALLWFSGPEAHSWQIRLPRRPPPAVPDGE
jgi:hypothetical protein